MTCVHCLRRKECAKQRKLMLTVDDIGEYTYQRNVEKDCLNFLDGDAALDLIKRQQALIEELQSIVFKQEEDKQKAQAENERLQGVIDSFTVIGKLYSEIKSEARKELAEIVHGIISPEYDEYHKAIDNLLKELDGKENSDENNSKH